jgi:hypothetical protein
VFMLAAMHNGKYFILVMLQELGWTSRSNGYNVSFYDTSRCDAVFAYVLAVKNGLLPFGLQYNDAVQLINTNK